MTWHEKALELSLTAAGKQWVLEQVPAAKEAAAAAARRMASPDTFFNGPNWLDDAQFKQFK